MGDLPWHALVVLLWLSSGGSSDPYENQPKLTTQNGHLFIITGSDKNITLRTRGSGYVNLNEDNLLHVAQMARRASDTVTRFQQNIETNIQARLDSLTRQVTGPHGLATKMANLEQAVISGNSSAGPASVPVTGPSRLSFGIRLNRLGSRLRSVEVQVRSLRNLLTLDECLSNPCRNGGTCQDMFNGFICICPINWQGTLCDVDVNECAMFAGTDLGCQNGATCVNKPGTYECLCTDTFFGLHCTLRTNDCSTANSAQLCGHGVCVNQGGNGRGYICICNEGWTTDLSNSCTVDVDECQSKRYPCSHDPYVLCINLPGSYHCGFCPPGFTGNGFQCADINECDNSNGGCSLVPRVSCLNTRGSRVCGHCPPGYTGDGVICTPVTGGACAINNGGCFPTAHCVQSGALVSCRCPDGYTGIGFGPSGCSASAMAVHPCHTNPCKNGGTCVANGMTAHCVCHPHLTGSDCSIVVFASCSPNPCLNNGTCSLQLVQGFSQLRCTCATGFEGDRCELMSSDCGGMFYQDSGELQVPSENAIQRFTDGKLCTWRIEVSSDKVVEITITQIVIDPSENCGKNYLRIQDSRAAGLWTSYCKVYGGEELPKVVTSLTNAVNLNFYSTSGIHKNHFKLSWKAIESNCGGEINAVNHGTIDSPLYPQSYPPNQNCEWKLMALPGKKIQLLFYTLDLEPSSDCSKDYIKIQEYENDEPGNLLAQFCNTSTPVPITTHLPAAYILFHSDSSGTGKGFRIMYTLQDGCGAVLTSGSGDISPPMSSDETYLSDQDCEWRIQLPLGNRMKITFHTFELEDKDVCDDFLEVRDGPSATSPLVGRWCGAIIPSPYISSTNTLTVIFHSDAIFSGAGFTIHYETLCEGVFTSLTGELRSPNYPLPYSNECECVFLISTPPATAIRLQFQDFETEKTGTDCEFDYVEIRDGDSNNATVIGRYCGSVKPPDILSTFNYLYILFTSDSSNKYRGFLANYSTIDIPCGAILKQSTGMFSSPQNEEGYLPNTQCKWLISAPPGWVIQLAWLTFHLEYSRDCQMDAVEVYENNTLTNNSTLIHKYCGLRLPPTTTSTTNMMTVTFRSDDSVHREGFTAHYVAVDKRRVCQGTYRSITGIVESPNYPGDYPDNKDCIWVIHVPQGQQIKLTFEVFEVEGNSQSCNYDSLEIRNGLHETSPVVGKYCGTELPPDVTSLTNGLRLHFNSDRSTVSKGFRATWDATVTGCGGTLTGPSGSITSPNYPQPYARNAECFFKISISEGSQVRLTIVDMDLEPHSSCGLDYIQVFDGLDDRSRSLGRFCSPSHPNSVLASKNHMYIKFVSDTSYSGRGFYLKYDTDCNITLKSRHGVVESPNYPGKYAFSLNCMWLIQAPLGNKLNISFVHFNLEDSARPFALPSDRKSEDCRYDYLEVSEGTRNQTPSNVLGRYCGSQVPPMISSQLDQVYLHFVTDHMIEASGFHLEWIVSGCGDLFQEKPRGTFTSPNYPNGYPTEVQCEWKIIAPWDKSIEITVKDLQMEDISKCDFDHLAIYAGEDDTAPVLMKACHHQTSPLTVTTSGNHAFIVFQSDSSVSGKGFSASWRFIDSKCGGKFTAPFGAIHSHNYPKNYENHDDCEWLIEVPPNHLVNLTFTDFDVEPSLDNSTTDYVNVYDGTSVSAPLLLSHSGNILPNPVFVVSTNNSLLIRHKADGSVTAKGFSAHYAMGCGARISAKGTGTFSLDERISSSSPWAPEYAFNCTWYIIAENPADKIMLTFTFLDASPNYENDDSACSFNYVAVHNGDDTNATILSRVCGTKLPLPVVSSGGALTVNAVSLTNMHGHLGRFSVLYSTYSTACGGELVSEQGAIASPNYPDGYPANVDCEWDLKASIGNKVTLSFLTFELEQSDYCNADYVEVRSGAGNGTLLGVFCGSEMPTNITAANSLWLRFRTNTLNTAKGFMAEYSLVHGNDLAGDSGQIASPLYPRHFIQSGEYKWSITVSNNKVVRISFTDFYIDRYSDEDCFMYLTIFDGPDVDSPALLQACGATLPTPVISTNKIVTIVFKNDPYVHGSFFLLSWEALSRDSALSASNKTTVVEAKGCEKFIHLSSAAENNSATITSPGHPQDYERGLECSWILDTSPGYHLELKFNTFDLEQYDNCDADFVVISTESTTTSTGWTPISPKLCFPNSTSLSFVAGSRMKVYFESDFSEQKTGFLSKVTSVCGGLLTDPTGMLDTTVLQATFMTGRVSCDWEFKVRSGRTIQFTFDQFNLPKLGRDSCINNFIMFRNGGYKDSPPLGDGKYCGRVAPLIPKSTSNRVFISYNAMASAPGVILRYEEVNFACKHDISLRTLRNVTISSPNYPQAPSTPHIACTWMITAPPGESIQLDFINRFDLKPSRDCEVEYIDIRDGGTELSPLIGHYCNWTPPPKVTQGNRMYIKYFTEADVPNNGFSAVAKVATCGGTYFDQIKVVVTSPQYPSKYPPNLDCLWRIVAGSADSQLRFNITELFLGEDTSCKEATEYIEFVNVDPYTRNMTDNPPPTRICGRLSSAFNGTALVPPSSSSDMYIRFHSGSQSNNFAKKRFAITVTTQRLRCNQEINAPSGVITTPGYPNPIPRRSYFYCSWIITVPEGRRVTFKMLDYDLEPSKENSWNEYKLSFYNGNNYMTAASADTFLQDKTIDSYSNKMKINYYEESISGAHRGFKAEFSSDKPALCGGRLEGKGSVGFSPLGQNLTTYWCEWSYNRDLLASNQSTFSVTVNGTFNTNSSGVCIAYGSTEDSIIIHIQSAGGFPGVVLAQICENTKAPITVRSPFSTLNIMAKKRAGFPRKGKIYQPSIANFSITYKTDLCGGFIQGPEATVTSPGFPGQYPANIDCAWVVKFQPNTNIHVKFESLDLDADCSKEFLILYNGDTPLQPHLTAPLCGNNMPAELITQDSVMYMEFHSDTLKDSHSGFKITLTQDSSGCGGLLHTAEGVIQSPNYGSGDYPNNTECDWTVVMPSGFHASLSFLSRFSLESSHACSNDYIQIFNWRDEKWEQIGENICGRTPPANLKTSTNKFRVFFRTNSSITSDGFQLSWTKLCGSIIDVTGDGVIISPNYPKVYFGDLNCNYTLLAPNRTIYGKFEDFKIEESMSADGQHCRFDNISLTTYSMVPNRFLQIFGSPGMSSRFLPSRQMTLCGSQIPEPVFSFSKLELIFSTDAFLNHKGFLFTYSVANCDGNITSPTIITNPNNTHFRNCTWFITAPDDKVVVLKIHKQKNYFGMCINNGLRLYDGHNVTNSSSLIDTICSNYMQRKTRFVSSGNKMAVQYYSSSFLPMNFQAAIGFTYGEKHKCGGTIRTAEVHMPYTLQAPDVNADDKYEALLSCDWLFLAPESHQMLVKFDKLDIQNCSSNSTTCTCDFLEIRDGDSQNHALVGRYCGSTTYPDVISSTGSLLVHFSTDGTVQLSGFQLSISTFLSPCGLTVRNATRELQVLQSPGYPHSTDSNQLCLWHIIAPPRGSGLLSLRFTDLDLGSPCTNNYVEIMEKMTPPFLQHIEGRYSGTDSRIIDSPIKVCGNRTTDLTFSSRSVQIHYITNQATNHRGFTLEFKMKGCSGNYTTPFGRLVANQIYQNYGDTTCNNLIQVPQANATISLYFNYFYCIEGDPSRESGKMLVYDGSSDRAEELATFCANRRPNPIFSSGPALYLKFQSITRFSKFDITYTSTTQGRGCGGTLSDLSGSFSSPLYPSKYNKDSSCRWDVSVPHGSKIYFYFIYFDIGQLHMCSTNYIQFYDIDFASGTESLHSRYCGQEKPAQIQMNGDSAFVRYVTTTHNNGTGWVLRWSSNPAYSLLHI